MTIPASEPIPPEGDERQAHIRRRQRPVGDPEGKGFAGSLETLRRLTTPSFDYYLGNLLAGIIAAAAMLLDAPAFFFLAVLFAPFLGPVFGFPLAAASGSVGFFLLSLFHLVLGGGLVFAIGALAGWLHEILAAGGSFSQLQLYIRPSWPDFLVVSLGSGLAAYLLSRSPRQKPLVANIAVAYGLVLPLAATGFGLTSNPGFDWTGGVVVVIARLALAAWISSLVFALVGYKPASLLGYFMVTAYLAAGVAAILFAASAAPLPQKPAEPAPASLPTAAPTHTAAFTATVSPQPEAIYSPSIQATSTPTETPTPSFTPTTTITIAPTPVWAKIDAPSGGGAFIRAEPGGRILTSLLNGSPVEVISEPLRVESGAIWVKIRTETGVEGWILQSLLATATPSPGW